VDDEYTWDKLTPEQQQKITARLAEVWADQDPVTYWGSMTEKDRRELLWGFAHPHPDLGAWVAEQNRIEQQADAATQAALDRLYGPESANGNNGNTAKWDDPDDELSRLPHPLDWAEFVQRDPDDRRWLIEGFWPWGRGMALWASGKEGKSELALWCALKLALGEHPWTGAAVDAIDVAYFDYEMTEDDLDDRLSDFDIDPLRLDRLHYWQLPALHTLDSEVGGDEIEALILSVGAQAVVIDTLARAVNGDENDADTIRGFYRHTGSRLKRHQIGLLRLDHAGKDFSKGQRGSSAKRDDVDVAWSQRRDKGGTGVQLDCTGSSRLGWVGPIFKVDRTTSPTHVISYSAPVRLGWSAGVYDKVAELDAAGVPLDAGRPAVIAALRAANKTPGKYNVLSEAIRFRRERAAITPVSRAGTAPGTAPTATTGNSPGNSPGTIAETAP
jgi:hypothetical protein